MATTGVLAGAILVALLALMFELVLAGHPAAADPAGREARARGRPGEADHRGRSPGRPHRLWPSATSGSHTRGRTPPMSTHPRLRALFALLAVARLDLGLRRLRRRRLQLIVNQRRYELDQHRQRRQPDPVEPRQRSISLTVGSKNFTEQYILGEIYAQGLEAAGYDVSTDLNLGSEQVALKALQNGEISRLPGVHLDRADLVLRLRARGRAGGCPAGVRAERRATSRRRGWSPTRRPRSRARTRSGCSSRRPTSSGSRRSPTSPTTRT